MEPQLTATDASPDAGNAQIAEHTHPEAELPAHIDPIVALAAEDLSPEAAQALALELGDSGVPVGDPSPAVSTPASPELPAPAVAPVAPAQAAPDPFAQLAQVLSYQAQQQQAALEAQNAKFEALVSALKPAGPKPKTRDEMTEVERFEHDILAKAESLADQKAQAALQRAQALEQKLAAYERQAADARLHNDIRSQAQTAVASYVLPELRALPPERLQALNGPMQELMVAGMAAYGAGGQDVGPHIKKLLDSYFDARLEVMNGQARASVQQNRQVARAPQARATLPATGDVFDVTPDQILKHYGQGGYHVAKADNFARIRNAK